jgi:hypothetical protein
MLILRSKVLYSAEDFRRALQEKRLLARTRLARRFDRRACEALHTIKDMLVLQFGSSSVDQPVHDAPLALGTKKRRNGVLYFALP